MAVNLLGSSDARVDFGDLAIDAGLTAITVSITLLASDVASDELVVSHWGTGAAQRAWLMQIQDTNELGFVVHKNPNFFGRKTTDLNLATGTLYRIVCRWRTSDDTVTIWVNGVSRTVTEFVASADVVDITDSTHSIQIGHETLDAIDGPDGDYSEFAIHGVYMSDDYALAYGKGYSPAFFRRNGLLYAPLHNINALNDRWGGAAGTNSGGTSASHPSVIYPSSPKIMKGSPPPPTLAPMIHSVTTLLKRDRVVAY